MGLKPQSVKSQGDSTRLHTKMEHKKMFMSVFDERRKVKKRIAKRDEKASKFTVAKSTFPEFISEDEK